MKKEKKSWLHRGLTALCTLHPGPLIKGFLSRLSCSFCSRYNASYAPLFVIKLEELPVNDKITAL